MKLTYQVSNASEKKLSLTWRLVLTDMLIFIHQDNLEIIYLDIF